MEDRSWSQHMLVILRVYLGLVLFVSGMFKVASDDFPFRMQRFLETALGLQTGDPGLPHAFGFYRPLIESVLLPNLGLFAFIVVALELGVGAALIVGATSRLAAGLAAFYLANLVFAWGAVPWSQAAEPAFFLIALLLAVTPSGRGFGVDRWLASQRPDSRLW